MENKLIIKIGKIFNIIDKSEIEYIKAERNYSRIYCDSKNFIVGKCLKELEGKLGQGPFIRVNKSTIVNIEKVERMKEVNNNKFIVEMRNQEVFVWGRGYKDKLTKLIKI